MIGLFLGATPAVADPMPSLTHTRPQMRNFDCERLGMNEAAKKYPGRIVASQSRAVDPDRTYVICTERWFRAGMRDPGDEALLFDLEDIANRIATTAATTWPELSDRTFLVETFHRSTEVSGKVGFAVKNALMGAGVRVSDRVPVLGAQDTIVLSQLDRFEAYPAACQRYAATGGLHDTEVLVAVIQLDPRETGLHSGLCVDGAWRWIE